MTQCQHDVTYNMGIKILLIWTFGSYKFLGISQLDDYHLSQKFYISPIACDDPPETSVDDIFESK